MIRVRRGIVARVSGERPGALELDVAVREDDGTTADTRALAYPALTGPVRAGDRVVLNTTAVRLGLGTGGWHLVMAVEGGPDLEAEGPGHTIKLRYTPEQLKVLAVEERDSPHRAAMEAATALEGLPVVWVPLHSLVAPAAAGAVAAGARVAYVMTDGAALPAPLSRLAARLRSAGLVDAVITAGQAFGGDLEAVNVFTALLAARHVAGAEVVVVGDGPGNTGTDTIWGATDIESAMSMHAAAILGGRPVAALRISFADPRRRHRAVSHHSLTALARVAPEGVHVAVPALQDEGRRREVWGRLTGAGLERRHQLVEVEGRPALDRLAEAGVRVESMGRSVPEDPEFFLAGGAAGILAGRMAAGDRAWRDGAGG
jgi:Protein of unknown function (DUF3866)